MKMKKIFENRTRTQQEKLQQYYTPDALKKKKSRTYGALIRP